MTARTPRRNGIKNLPAARLLLPFLALPPALSRPAASPRDWPARPLPLVVPFTAGGGTAVAARLQAQSISDILGQSIVIENVGGGAGMTAGVRVAHAAPDGYTFLI